MQGSIKYIENLIIEWCINQGHYGLTLPNFIGAIRTNTDKKSYSIKDFFKDISSVSLEIQIRTCPDLDEFVFGIFKREDAPKSYYKVINSIYYSKSQISIENYQDLIDFFEKKYSDKIEKGLYSIDYYTKDWGGINEEDRELYKQIAKKTQYNNGNRCTTP